MFIVPLLVNLHVGSFLLIPNPVRIRISLGFSGTIHITGLCRVRVATKPCQICCKKEL